MDDYLEKWIIWLICAVVALVIVVGLLFIDKSKETNKYQAEMFASCQFRLGILVDSYDILGNKRIVCLDAKGLR